MSHKSLWYGIFNYTEDTALIQSVQVKSVSEAVSQKGRCSYSVFSQFPWLPEKCLWDLIHSPNSQLFHPETPLKEPTPYWSLLDEIPGLCLHTLTLCLASSSTPAPFLLSSTFLWVPDFGASQGEIGLLLETGLLPTSPFQDGKNPGPRSSGSEVGEGGLTIKFHLEGKADTKHSQRKQIWSKAGHSGWAGLGKSRSGNVFS